MYKALRKIVLAAVFVLGINGNAKAQTYVLIPDANFANYLQLLIPSAMSGNSLNITSTLVTTSTQSIIVNSSGISSLSGVEYFTSLTFLRCYNNFLTSLPALPNSLTYLQCAHNPLTSLPTLPNTLTFLDCSYNPLTSFPTLPNTLTDLICISSSLTSLPSLPNSLTYLSCGQNFLTSLPTLPNSLTTLYCNSNNIKCFPLFPASITSPWNINLSNNPFNCLPNYVLPSMNAYTTTPLCAAGNTNGCAVIGINELKPNNIQITIYPNPSKGAFSLKIEDEINNGELMLINSIGQIIYTSKIARGENKITSGITSSGLYQYIILQNKQQLSRGKLVIE